MESKGCTGGAMQLDAKNAFIVVLVLIVCAAAYFAFFAQPTSNPMQPSVNVTGGDERPPLPPENSGTMQQPSVSISINNGAVATNSPQAMLYLSGMNVARCMFSTGKNIWGEYEAFSAQKQILFENESEGNKTVHVRCVNADGTQIADAQAQILLDVKKPSVYVEYKGLFENETRLELWYGAADVQDATPLCAVLVNGVEIENKRMEKKQVDKIIYNSEEIIEGVNVSCVDFAGNVGYKEVFTPSAQAMWIKIENGSANTPSRSVMLYLYARNASECRYRNEEHDWSAWGNYTKKRGWLLTDEYGNRTVYYNCARRDGSEIGTESAFINYYSSGGSSGGETGNGGEAGQQGAPTDLQVSINNGAVYSTSGEVALSLSASNAQQCSYSTDQNLWTLNAPYTASMQFALSAGDGLKYAYYVCSNQYGTSEVVSDSIIVDSTAPAPVSGLSASPRAQSGSIYLSWGGNQPFAYANGAVVQAAPVSYEIYRQAGALLNGAEDGQGKEAGMRFASGSGSWVGEGAYFGAGNVAGTGGMHFAAGANTAIPAGAALIGTTANNYFEDTSALDGQSYTYSVRAVDAAGNRAQSASVSADADFYTLSVSSSSPVEGGAYVDSADFTYSVMLSAGAKADCTAYVDNVEKDSRTLLFSQSPNIPVALSEGAHTGKVSCRLQKSVRAAVNTPQVSFSISTGGEVSSIVKQTG